VRRLLLLISLLSLALWWAATAAAGPSRGPFALSHCDWRTGSGCPPVPTHCSLRGPAQDPICTPGALNPAVRQSTIGSTICKSGYTSRVRPPTSHTDPLKLESMRAYDLGTDTSAYEFDHLISLELGGAPSDIRNLWPEANYAPSFSYRKDGLENSLNAKVCNRTISLAAAQRRIVHWVRFVSTGGAESPTSPETPAPVPTPPTTPSTSCDPAYPTVCIPPPPPDLDCSQISYRNFQVLAPDPHHFDGDGPSRRRWDRLRVLGSTTRSAAHASGAPCLGSCRG
jgi:hypothetical protein